MNGINNETIKKSLKIGMFIILNPLNPLNLLYADSNIKLNTQVQNKVNYQDREFISIGMLGDNHKFVCINSEKWLEYYTDNKIELSKMYYFDEELQKDIPFPCQ